MKWQARIKKGGIEFPSKFAEVRLYEHAGKRAFIELDDKPSLQMRRFFEGAVVPYVFYQSPYSWTNL